MPIWYFYFVRLQVNRKIFKDTDYFAETRGLGSYLYRNACNIGRKEESTNDISSDGEWNRSRFMPSCSIIGTFQDNLKFVIPNLVKRGKQMFELAAW